MFVTFHNARFIRADLPNKLAESHTGYTDRGSLGDRSKQRSVCEKSQSLAV